LWDEEVELERMCVDWDEGGGMGRTVLSGGEGNREEGICERVLRMMSARGLGDVLNVTFSATGVRDEDGCAGVGGKAG